jgi:hypothetical protein
MHETGSGQKYGTKRLARDRMEQAELLGIVEGLVNRGLQFHPFCEILIEFKAENNSYWQKQ